MAGLHVNASVAVSKAARPLAACSVSHRGLPRHPSGSCILIPAGPPAARSPFAGTLRAHWAAATTCSTWQKTTLTLCGTTLTSTTTRIQVGAAQGCPAQLPCVAAALRSCPVSQLPCAAALCRSCPVPLLLTPVALRCCLACWQQVLVACGALHCCTMPAGAGWPPSNCPRTNPSTHPPTRLLSLSRAPEACGLHQGGG